MVIKVGGKKKRLNTTKFQNGDTAFTFPPLKGILWKKSSAGNLS